MDTSNNAELVSVVIPAFNVAWCVERAIESVLSQTYPCIETIVVNDGSTDDTATILQKYEKKIHVVNQKNAGLSNARNTGILATKGEYIAFLDADDYFYPEKISMQVKLFRENPEIGFCSAATEVRNIQGDLTQIWGCPSLERKLLETLFAKNGIIPGSGSSVMVRSNILKKTSLFDERLKSLEDIDMWMRLAAVTGYACIEKPLSVIIKREDSMSANLQVMKENAVYVLKKNRALLPPPKQKRYWRSAYAGILADYATGAYRQGKRLEPIRTYMKAFWISPLEKGPRMISYMISMLFKKDI